MTRLQWNGVTDRFFEVGLDRGVLYTSNGSVVPWNGLLSIKETSSVDYGTPVYVDGRLVYQDQDAGNFSATLTAFTFPDEFIELAGFEEAHDGVFLDNQQVDNTFALSWRTLVGNGSNESDGYKIHILFNASAVPNAVNRETLSEDLDPIHFAWDLKAIPEEVTGYRPTSHVVIDSRKIDRYRLYSIEKRLYGDDGTPPSLTTLAELMDYIEHDVLIRITDNGDGTWTAEGPDDLIKTYGPDWFSIDGADATFIDDRIFTISTTEY